MFVSGWEGWGGWRLARRCEEVGVESRLRGEGV